MSESVDSPPSVARQPVFRVRGLTKIYGAGAAEVRALSGVDLDLYGSELVVLLGPSGSGKTTLLNNLGGLDVPTSGELTYRGQNLAAIDETALTRYRRDTVGFVFQFYNLIPSLTARENVGLITEIARDPMPAEEALDMVNLGARLDHFPAQLSGGEQQRVAIARAIAKRPEVLLCDEPTGALDVRTGIVVLEAIQRANRELGTLTVIITHNAIMADMADRVIHLSDGHVHHLRANEHPVPASSPELVMLSHLDRKLWRDLRRMKGQAFAVAMVMGCGLAMMIMARSLIYSLESTRREYYEANRFAEVFAHMKRAPNSLAARIKDIPGVAAVQPGISVQVTLDLPTLDEPASGMVRSLPDFAPPELNRLFLRTGRWLAPGSRGEMLVGEAFADANHLLPGDSIAMLLNGRRQQFKIAGIVLSPEFIFESRPGAALPDNRTYGTFWMPYKELATAFDLYGAFNYLALTLEPGGMERSVIAELDRMLTQYGGRGAYGRADHPSHIRVSDEIRVLETISIGFPIVFLSVAAFMINAVLSRLLNLQREQIAIMKAFGFTNRQIVMHYLKFAFVIVAGGTVLGGCGGVILGHRLVMLYHHFFRFPDLAFRADRTAFPLALLVCAAAATAGVFGAVRRAARLPPAEAMRPEPPANYRPALVERTGIAHLLSHTFRIAVRNLERRPMQALFTVAGLALATGILIVPNGFRDSVAQVLDTQWDTVQRQDLSIGLVEPDSVQVQHLFGHLPGVVRVEPFRSAFARIGFGHQRRQLGIQGLPSSGLHNRVLDDHDHLIKLPPEGLVVSLKLAEVLGARIGDELRVEILEGKRPVRNVRLVGVSGDFTGMTAYMDLPALNRLLGEGDVISGANFLVDDARRVEFLRALKGIPRVSWVAIKDSLRENFRQTTAASIGLIQKIYLAFAIVVAFGVVYNNARISLAERARELATLRVIGFSRREVGAVLVTELVVLALIAVPLGLLLGTGFAKAIIRAVNTETVRLPLVLTASNYAFAVLVVTIASTLSALLVLRLLHHLDLVSALKAPE